MADRAPRRHPGAGDGALVLGVGFLLTLITLRLVPALLDTLGWRVVFVVLAPGPLVGIFAMLRLGRLPEAERMAGGNR